MVIETKSSTEQTQAQSEQTQATEEELLALVEEKAAPEGGTEGKEKGTEPQTGGDDILKSLGLESDEERKGQEAALREEAKRQARQEADAEYQDRQEKANQAWQSQQLEANFRGRIGEIRKLLTEANLEAKDIDDVVNRFNEHHAQSASIVSIDFGRAIRSAILASLPTEERESFAAVIAKAPTWESLFQKYNATVVEGGRKGWRTEAEYQKARREGATQALTRLATKPDLLEAFLSRIKAPADRGGGGGIGSGWTTKEQARNLHAQGKLTSAEMRRINADPMIPEGYGLT